MLRRVWRAGCCVAAAPLLNAPVVRSVVRLLTSSPADVIMCALQVCEEAKCPNKGECWGGGDGHIATATIMVCAGRVG